MTFDVMCDILSDQVGWRRFHEAFCVCRHCGKSTVFVLGSVSERAQLTPGTLRNLASSVNGYLQVEDFICVRNMAAVSPPESVPPDIHSAFTEGATCMAVGCYNAAGTMFRLCVDIATRSKLPPGSANHQGLNANVRRSLGLRLQWLFDNGHLPEALRELSICIKDDGNDGAHAGNLDKAAAEDLQDFTTALLERMYTEPERLRLAKERRDKRQGSNQPTAAKPPGK